MSFVRDRFFALSIIFSEKSLFKMLKSLTSISKRTIFAEKNMKTIREIYEEQNSLVTAIDLFLCQLEPPDVGIARPKKPTEGTSEVWEKYAKDLAAFEEAYQRYRKLSESHYERRRAMEEELRLFLLELSGWLGHPKQDNAWKYAWNKGHSESYYRVYVILEDLHEYFA